ncbi:hypothetical protein I6F65_20075 [Pseudoalteromonas sp. SWXJZ94C]|uniref:hypothetical protein n=1 Tax=unclassified Pseudoalteromonas TaxID=194690 RepID=UPI001408B594|nr:MULTISPECIES: hypothetical protein [unclassified Pseudoalteromonas]MBH0059243.1 hypothetical protein [Pseudoalteromonas sp. SWXJZ94C]
MIEVILDQDAKTNELLISFTNKYNKVCFIDHMRIFKNERYTVACLDIYDLAGKKISRLKHLRLRAPKFPDDYLKLEAGQTYLASLDLNKHFKIETNEIIVQYNCYNSSPISEERQKMSSNKITMCM